MMAGSVLRTTVRMPPRSYRLVAPRHRYKVLGVPDTACGLKSMCVVPDVQAAADCRVLSIQSHVVHGCVGNRAAIFPLQLLGVETDVLNTVQFSNHAGFGTFTGEKLSGDALWALIEGMDANGLLAPSHLLTGYMGSLGAMRAVLRALPLFRRSRNEFQFWCDPVLGDHGRLYVASELVDAYRTEVRPKFSVVVPIAGVSRI